MLPIFLVIATDKGQMGGGSEKNLEAGALFR